MCVHVNIPTNVHLQGVAGPQARRLLQPRDRAGHPAGGGQVVPVVTLTEPGPFNSGGAP